MVTATGAEIVRTGQLREVWFQTLQGHIFQLVGEIMPIRRPILSVGRWKVDHQNQQLDGTVHFGAKDYIMDGDEYIPLIEGMRLFFLCVYIVPEPSVISLITENRSEWLLVEWCCEIDNLLGKAHPLA